MELVSTSCYCLVAFRSLFNQDCSRRDHHWWAAARPIDIEAAGITLWPMEPSPAAIEKAAYEGPLSG
jgi:hypothetical protein